MSLVEPLLPKEGVEDQKQEKSFNDPIANLEKSFENLSVEFKSFELDGASDIKSYDSDDVEEKFYEMRWIKWAIKCAATFKNKLVIGRIDGIIKVYDLDTKEEIVLKGHSQNVNCLQVTIKEDFLVSGSRDTTIIIWNLETYNQERVFKTEYPVFCLEVTSGYNLFSGSLKNCLINKWNFWDENEASSLRGHEDGITCMKSSKNNQFLITGSLDQSLRIWSIENSQELRVLRSEKSKGVFHQVIITDDNKYLVTESQLEYNGISIWDLDKGEVIIFTHAGTPIFLSINNASNCIIHNSFWEVWVYNIKNEFEKKEFKAKNGIIAMACSKKNNFVYCGLDRTVKIADIKELNTSADLKDFDSNIYMMLLIGNNEEYLATIMENGKIKIHEIYKEREQEDLVIDYNGGASAKLSRDGKYLYIKAPDLLTIWNLIEKTNVCLYTTKVWGLIISYDNNNFAFKDSNFIYVYSFQDMKEVSKIDMENLGESFDFTISKDSRFIAAGNSNGVISVVDIENECKIYTLEGKGGWLKSLQITKNNEYIISTDNSGRLYFWSILEKKLLNCFYCQYIYEFKLIDKYNYVAICLEHSFEIWDYQKQIKITSIQPGKNYFKTVVINEDETYFILPLLEEFTIWSLEDMKEIDSNIPAYRPNKLVISKNSKYILAIEDDVYLKLWSYEEKRFISKTDFSGLKVRNAEFIREDKAILVFGDNKIWIYSLEELIDCNYKANPYPYFISGMKDKIRLQKCINWIKSPSENPWESVFLDVVVGPIGYNLLHYLCIHDKADLLSIALKNGGEIFRDKQNMSPLSYALIRNSRRCIDEILDYVINLEDDKKMYYCIHQLRDDIPLLFNSKSLNLVPFLEVLFRRRADKDHVGFYEVSEELPISIFSPISKIYTSAFTAGNATTKQNESLIQFWGSLLGYNYTEGSEESLFLLKKIDESENQDIFQTLFVQSVIREKWNYLWPAIITISIIYWLNLIAMMWHILDPSIYILSSFAVLNGILALYEFLQFGTKPKDYVSEIWNLVDFIRMALSVTWAILQFYDENIELLSFALVLINFLRGLTYFRAFDFTRFYVRLILMALTDSLAFLIIFLYSTLAFGVLYASLDTDLSFGDMWSMAYELNMGNFDNGGFSFLQYSCFTLATLINVVMMLNLLVATLGDTFDRFQMITDELDTKEMLQLVIEFESMMFWGRSEQAKLRNKGKLLYLQRCDNFQDSDVPDKWQGKIKELSLKIDAVKDDALGNKKSISEELKKLDENIKESFEKIIKSQEKNEKENSKVNGKVEDMELKINGKISAMESKIDKIDGKFEELESKINGMIELIKVKLDA